MLFSEFIGQEEIKEYLKTSIIDGEVSHAYIFDGPKGAGKFDLAYLFAQSILCKDFNGEPCNLCTNCIKVNTNNYPDIHIVLPQKGKTIKVGDVEAVIESIGQKSYEGGKKIYIFKNSEMIGTEAANKLLKTLEEPLGDTVIILLTENIDLLLPTIVSRCQILKFTSLKDEIIADYLNKNYNIDIKKAKLISGYSKGVMNNAISIIEGKNDILELRNEVLGLYDKLITGKRDVLSEYEDFFEKRRNQMKDIVEILCIWLMDLLYERNDLEELVVNTDKIDLIYKHINLVSTDNINNDIAYLQRVVVDVKMSVNYKLVISNMLIKLQEERFRW